FGIRWQPGKAKTQVLVRNVVRHFRSEMGNAELHCFNGDSLPGTPMAGCMVAATLRYEIEFVAVPGFKSFRNKLFWIGPYVGIMVSPVDVKKNERSLFKFVSVPFEIVFYHGTCEWCKGIKSSYFLSKMFKIFVIVASKLSSDFRMPME